MEHDMTSFSDLGIIKKISYGVEDGGKYTMDEIVVADNLHSRPAEQDRSLAFIALSFLTAATSLS